MGVREGAGIVERTFGFSISIVRLCRHLEGDQVARVLARQLLRSGTSIGANVHEAQGGQSKADFVHKMSIAQKEAMETVYWLRLLRETKLLSGDQVAELLDETQQLVKIISKILVTSKAKKSAKA